MKSKYLSLLIALFIAANAYSQNIFPSTGSAGIGTTTPNASSILDMVSTTKGILIPRMTIAQRKAMVPPVATGLLIYQTNSLPGFYYYTGTAWQAITPKAGWLLTGNAGTDPATNFIGTTDAQPLVFKVNNQKAGYLGTTTNTAFGYQTLNVTSGLYNTASGFRALYINTTGHDNTANGFWSLVSNTIGYYNTATGGYSLYSNSDGIGNTANGISALRFNTHGNDNTAVGANALYNNTTGHSNVAIGSNALFHDTIGSNSVAVGDSALYNQNDLYPQNYGYPDNTAVGSKALYSNTTGDNNTATGYQALYSNSASGNTAVGSQALYSNTIAIGNTATGWFALSRNTTGSFNTATGDIALLNNTVGESNSAFGNSALVNNKEGAQNTAIGCLALYSNSGSNNTAIGYQAYYYFGFSSSFSNSTALGANSIITASNQVRIGDNTITSIGGYEAWTNISDGRVKKNIKENVPGLAFINLLKPITYNLDLDAADKILQRPIIKDKNGKTIQPSQEEMNARNVQQKIVCTGFIAQEVEATAKKIGYDFDGVDAAKNDKDLYGLRYSEFVVPLVKAVQELSKMNDSKDAKINDLETRLAKLEAMMNVYSQSTPVPLNAGVNSQQSTAIFSASLQQNIPNPFSNSTTISYNLPQTFKTAQIIITDKSGKTLKQVNLPAGRQGVSGSGKGSMEVNASTLAAGAYQYSLFIDGKLIDTKQMVLTK